MHLSLEGKVLKHCKEIVRLCSFGKYPYSQHRRFFFWFGIKDPSPLEFPVTFHGGGDNGYFLEPHITNKLQRLETNLSDHASNHHISHI